MNSARRERCRERERRTPRGFRRPPTPLRSIRAPRRFRFIRSLMRGRFILALVDELAMLAADLWFAGKLDQFPVHEEPPDADDL